MHHSLYGQNAVKLFFIWRPFCGYFYPLDVWVMALDVWVIERARAAAAIGGEREIVG
jgi:hypothetical protein